MSGKKKTIEEAPRKMTAEDETSEAQSLGQINYEAFRRACKFRSLVSGDFLPEYEDQSQEMMDAWAAAGLAVRDAVVGPYNDEKEKSDVAAS